MKKYPAYHFTNSQGTLGFGDGREVRVGETLEVDCVPALCVVGLHGSRRVSDALGYASGARLWKVEIWGKVESGTSKLVGTHRKALVDYGDVLPLIVEYAGWCAERAAGLYRVAYTIISFLSVPAAESAEYAAEYAAESAKYAAESAKYAEYAAEYAAESAKYAEYAAEYAAESAKYAKSAAESERDLQEQWWQEKLNQLKS